ncbi:MAG: FAD-binding oxidoreductase [Alphaproteobacteria bacterium]|nr:MAG: FAD-binding oxidoreductase [Alphaproteobacteria bacterium]
MRKIAIIGAGQSGLQLGIGLVQKGYEVTVYSNRRPEEIEKGRILSSQCMFDMALQYERDLGINFWEEECPNIDGISFTMAGPEGTKVFEWAARLDGYAQSVDQRVKMPGWMKAFEEQGGTLVFEEASIATLEKLARTNDLVLVASGKGEIGKLFKRDDERSRFDRPMRALGLTYVNNLVPRDAYTAVCFNVAPGVGEYFVFPALTTTGPCEIMVFEGVPGGPMDCWKDVTSPEQHLERSKEILETWFPWEAERARDCELTDDNGILAGRFPPTVRKPVLELPSGGIAMGMADAILLNDPITGQGSNNASKCANLFLKRILERGTDAFDRQWMQETFDAYWAYAETVVRWTNSMLVPPKPHVMELLQAAANNPQLAHRIVNGFTDPTTYDPWWFEPEEAERLIAA